MMFVLPVRPFQLYSHWRNPVRVLSRLYRQDQDGLVPGGDQGAEGREGCERKAEGTRRSGQAEKDQRIEP